MDGTDLTPYDVAMNDGIDDVLIGADNAQLVFPERPGAAYVIFGKTLANSVVAAVILTAALIGCVITLLVQGRVAP